jgi:flavin-dependent dehydrogenase
MHDVIVIGARVAGASTAMLLARGGLDVLAVDRAAFPSDTLSTHQVQVPGIARLKRWGILDRVIAAGTPATRRVRFDPGPAVLSGSFPVLDGADALYSRRRTILDQLLVDAAREAGAEVREQFAVQELLFDGDHVVGIRGRARGGAAVNELARLVIGADGRHSMLAKTVRAPAYHVHAPRSIAYYTYWSGVPTAGGEMYMRDQPQRAVGAWPTNDGLLMTYVAAPASEFGAFRADPEGMLIRSLDTMGDLGERVRAGQRAARVYGTADTQNRFHKPFGPGWALVGDAGLVMDPITGRGITDAFADAELLADAVLSGLDGGPPIEQTLAEYQSRRDAAVLPMYEMTLDVASLAPPRPEQRMLLSALEGDQAQIDRFLGVLGGVISPAEYFTPRNMLRLIGVRGLLQAIRSRRRMRT